MTTLQVTRPREWQNKLRKYQLYVDGEKVGDIANGETKDFILPEGLHTVVAKIDWCSSPELTFNLKDGDVQYVKVASSKVMQLASLIVLPLLLLNIFIKIRFKHDFIFYLAVPIGLILIYMFTLGRKKYLRLESF